MKYTYKIEDICCASCSSKIERAANKVNGISNFKINIMSQKINFESENNDLDSSLKEIKKIISRYEPDCKVNF